MEKIFVLKNSVHGTEFKIVLKSIYQDFGKIRQCWEALCGNPNCICGANELGMVGPDNPDVEFVRDIQRNHKIIFAKFYPIPEITPEFQEWLKKYRGIYRRRNMWYEDEYYGTHKLLPGQLYKLHDLYRRGYTWLN